MEARAGDDVTGLLVAWNDSDPSALDRLIPTVYAELRQLAHRQMRRERQGHLLQTTALVNEAYLRLIDITRVHWRNRAHFFAMSAQVMRRVLVDLARQRDARKRAGGLRLVPFDEVRTPAPDRGMDVLALDEALDALARFDERKARVVELRYFGGLSVDEAAEVLSVSANTITRDWGVARLWLAREMTRPAMAGRSEGP